MCNQHHLSKKEIKIIQDEAALRKEAEKIIEDEGDISPFFEKISTRDVIERSKLVLYVKELVDKKYKR